MPYGPSMITVGVVSTMGSIGSGASSSNGSGTSSSIGSGTSSSKPYGPSMITVGVVSTMGSPSWALTGNVPAPTRVSSRHTKKAVHAWVKLCFFTKGLIPLLQDQKLDRKDLPARRHWYCSRNHNHTHPRNHLRLHRTD